MPLHVLHRQHLFWWERIRQRQNVWTESDKCTWPHPLRRCAISRDSWWTSASTWKVTIMVTIVESHDLLRIRRASASTLHSIRERVEGQLSSCRPHQMC